MLLVALQIAMCLALLVASSLAVRSLLNYERQEFLGMQAESLLAFDVHPPQAFPMTRTHPSSIGYYWIG